MISRRSTLLGLIAANLWPLGSQALEILEDRFLAVETNRVGRSRLIILSQTGERLGELDLTHRAHGFAQTTGILVAFARRPGNRFSVMNLNSKADLHSVECPVNRRFYGHGAFSRDGRILVATEANLATLDGCLGLYDAADGFQRVGEIQLPIPGPHEIIALRSGGFAVCLGGLKTHPKSGRLVLNLGSFKSGVALYSDELKLKELYANYPFMDGVSYRHLAELDSAKLAIGGQRVRKNNSGKASAVALALDESGLSPYGANPIGGGYIGSVASQGSTALFSDRDGGSHLNSRAEFIGNAVAVAFSSSTTLWLRDTEGQIGDAQLLPEEGWQWDNHAVRSTTL